MIQNAVYLHAALGGIALLSGFIALCMKKGGKAHRVSGKIFFWSMLIAALVAMVIALLPEHESPFLFAVGIFSIYLISTGYLALRYKRKEVSFTFDKLLAIVMIITGIGMIAVPIIYSGKLHIILTVFATIGIILSIQDLRSFRNPDKLRKSWLQAHLGKMIGGYIAAVTAFIVVNNVFPSLVGWLGPTVVGTAFIIYWTRKVSPKSR